MKLSFLFLKSVFVEGWDGPWDGINAMTDNVLQSNDNMELNRDPKLTFVGRVDSYYISYGMLDGFVIGWIPTCVGRPYTISMSFEKLCVCKKTRCHS